ncbi:MAG: flagellar hook-associated protein FlgK [Pseudomonadota bacterium]|nr:flagellar hook-associated protein FlgK [Pseudomonadota bacterium]
MAGNLLNIGKTGLYAAQAGLSTTGHNIANANTVGFSRQTVIQSSLPAQNMGNGFSGSGTEVADIQRFSDQFLNSQVRVAQSSASALSTYGAQIGQIDNLLADTTSGLSPTLQDFFKSVQDLTANAGSTASRQSFLSSAESLAARFQGINGRLDEIRSGVNSQISSNVDLVNSYATQIAKLNDQIGVLATSTGHAPNDLLDARDQLVLELNKHVKATAVPGANSTVTVSIGSGQPLVVGSRAFQLATTSTPGDPSRLGVGYVTPGGVTPMADATLSGGELGGLLDFRTGTLDPAQNSLGRIAMGMAASYNAQNRLGVDSAGNPGGDLFTLAAPQVSANLNKLPPDPAAVPGAVAVTLSDPSKLTTSDYTVAYDVANSLYNVTRLSDHKVTAVAYGAPGPATQSIDGLDFTFSGGGADGDNYLVRPTIGGAAQFKVAALDVGAIAAAAPILTSAIVTNKGGAVVSEGSVDKNFLLPSSVFTPATLQFDAVTKTLTGFTSGQTVKVTDAAGAAVNYVAGTDPIPYAAGSTYTFGGVSIAFKGQPVDGDQFSVARNASGGRDNRNMLLLGALQSTPLFDHGGTTYQGAFAQLVGAVGNKAREVQVNSAASDTMLAQTSAAQQSVSGVNLDEEAANLLKYQQAYQAAGKIMQIASTLFDTLLSLGR